MKSIASYGFFVVAYESCPIDSGCKNGQQQFLEALKTVRYLEDNAANFKSVNFSAGYSASGHSTGARSVLILAAARDNVNYLKGMSDYELTSRDRTILAKFKCVVGDHPDPMYDPKQNPDISRFNISKTPVMLVTGTLDFRPIGEPTLSAWKDFNMMPALKHRIFFNIRNATHLNPCFSHPEAPFIAWFAQYHVDGNKTAGNLVYGNTSSEALCNQRSFLALRGETNNGGSNKEVSCLALCSDCDTFL